jgi:hypothetical protein
MVNELSQTEVYNTSDKFYVILILEKNHVNELPKKSPRKNQVSGKMKGGKVVLSSYHDPPFFQLCYLAGRPAGSSSLPVW